MDSAPSSPDIDPVLPLSGSAFVQGEDPLHLLQALKQLQFISSSNNNEDLLKNQMKPFTESMKKIPSSFKDEEHQDDDDDDDDDPRQNDEEEFDEGSLSPYQDFRSDSFNKAAAASFPEMMNDDATPSLGVSPLRLSSLIINETTTTSHSIGNHAEEISLQLDRPINIQTKGSGKQGHETSLLQEHLMSSLVELPRSPKRFNSNMVHSSSPNTALRMCSGDLPATGETARLSSDTNTPTSRLRETPITPNRKPVAVHVQCTMGSDVHDAAPALIAPAPTQPTQSKNEAGASSSHEILSLNFLLEQNRTAFSSNPSSPSIRTLNPRKDKMLPFQQKWSQIRQQWVSYIKPIDIQNSQFYRLSSKKKKSTKLSESLSRRILSSRSNSRGVSPTSSINDLLAWNNTTNVKAELPLQASTTISAQQAESPLQAELVLQKSSTQNKAESPLMAESVLQKPSPLTMSHKNFSSPSASMSMPLVSNNKTKISNSDMAKYKKQNDSLSTSEAVLLFPLVNASTLGPVSRLAGQTTTQHPLHSLHTSNSVVINEDTKNAVFTGNDNDNASAKSEQQAVQGKKNLVTLSAPPKEKLTDEQLYELLTHPDQEGFESSVPLPQLIRVLQDVWDMVKYSGFDPSAQAFPL